MKETSNKRAVIVGVFIFIGLLFLIGSVLTIGNLHSTFQKKLTVSTVFGDVNGLASGNNIWFSGVKIGTVKKTEFYGKSQVKVLMNINLESQQYIRKDAKVKIGTDGLIGNKILIVYGGTAEAPEVQEGDTLSNEHMLSTDDIMNTFQENNVRVLTLAKKLVNGEGTIGKLINNDSIYRSIAATSASLQKAAANAQMLLASLANFSSKLNTRGSLVNRLVTDTTVFTSVQASVLQLHRIADTAAVFINSLKVAGANPKSTVGVLLHDEQAGASLKTTINNLESSSKKLDQDLEAIQHNFLLRGYFKSQMKKEKK